MHMVAKVQSQIFISYARADDEAFVERLHRDLETAGLVVWWDRDTMASRGRTFLQEIRDAIETVDRVIAVIGPGAIRSEYVRYEWEHALLFAKGLLPILRLGDYSLVPSELLPEDDHGLAATDLGSLHCPDFRAERPYEEALKELVAIIRQPVASLGAYDGTPALPPYFLPRRDDLQRLKEKVLADVLRPTVITSAKQIVAIQGMGGIGKSVLAAAFARAINTRRVMADGILWLSAGRDATKLTLLDNMKAIGTAFGGAEKEYLDEASARRHLPKVLENKTCLIILDDVWSMEQVEPFRDSIGPRCRLLITTRDGSLVTTLEAQEQRVDVLSDEQALALLADWSGQIPDALPEGARRVAEECGNLPFALALCGAMARDGTPWPDLLDALHEADLTFIEARLPRYEFPNVLRAIRASVDMLARTAAAAVGRYHELAVFPSDAAVPEAAVLTLWCRAEGFSERNARKLLTALGRKALLTVQGESPDRRVSLHDLQHDYLRAVAGDGISTLHGILVDAYRLQCPGGWASGTNDGYFFDHLRDHLLEAGLVGELCQLLLDLAWLERKATIGLVFDLPRDYAVCLRACPADDPRRRNIRLLEQAIRNDINFIARHPSTVFQCLWNNGWWYDCDEAKNHLALPEEGWPRMRPPWEQDEPRLSTLLERWRIEKEALQTGFVWLRSLRPPPWPLGNSQIACMFPIRDRQPSPRVFDTRPRSQFPDEVNNVVISSDGTRIVSGAADNTIRIWDVQTGKEINCLFGHGGGVNGVAFSPDGGRIVSGADDTTIRIWDAKSGAELACLRGHAWRVYSVAISPDGAYIVSCSRDGTIRLWNAEPSKELAVPQEMGMPSSQIRCIGISPVGMVVVGVHFWDNRLLVFDGNTGRLAARLPGPEIGNANQIEFSPGGSVIVEFSEDTCFYGGDPLTFRGSVPEPIRALGLNLAKPRDYPWAARRRGSETVVERFDDGREVAWFPLPLEEIATHPSGHTWAGSGFDGVYVAIITLEGDLGVIPP
jgi:hypothetical protein